MTKASSQTSEENSRGLAKPLPAGESRPAEGRPPQHCAAGRLDLAGKLKDPSTGSSPSWDSDLEPSPGLVTSRILRHMRDKVLDHPHLYDDPEMTLKAIAYLGACPSNSALVL